MKIFEKVIYTRLFNQVKDDISINQHGFMRGRSITSNLMLYTNYVTNAFEDGLRVDVHTVYTDFSKAFDKVNIHILLRKLAHYGVAGNLYKWMISYLIGRQQYVAFNGAKSKVYVPNSGVPAGSILGPILFNLFVNHLGRIIISDFGMFADDLKIYREIVDAADYRALQMDILALEEWCRRNKLKLNENKCSLTILSNKRTVTPYAYVLGGRPLNRVDSIKDLGVTVDSKLSFRLHVDNIVRRGYKMLGFVMRIGKEFRNKECLKFLYSALVRSGLEFASVIWRPHARSRIDQIEKVQKKFTRFLHRQVNGSSIREEYNQRCMNLKLPQLESRREEADAMLLYRIVSGQLDSDAIGFIHFRVNVNRIRSQQTFVSNPPRTEVVRWQNPLRRVQSRYDLKFREIDMFAATMPLFRQAVRGALYGW